MFIARWQVEARFGYKQSAINSMKKWLEEVGSEIGWKLGKLKSHKKWGRDFEKFIVSGTARWQIFRIISD